MGLFAAPPLPLERIGFVSVGLQEGGHVENLLKIPGLPHHGRVRHPRGPHHPGGAFVLARHGAVQARTDAGGKTPFDLAGVRARNAEITDAELTKSQQWFAPGGPCATVPAMMRASGTPMSEDAALEVAAKLETTPRRSRRRP